MAGIKFPLEKEAEIFLSTVLQSVSSISSTPIVARVASPKLSRIHGRYSITTKRKISKEEISTPCMFAHVTSASMIKTNENNESKGRSKSLNEKRSRTFSAKKGFRLLKSKSMYLDQCNDL